MFDYSFEHVIPLYPPHILSYYREESLRDDPKMLARSFTIAVNVGITLIKEGIEQA